MSGTMDIREWAKAHGYDLADKGRIPAEVHHAYDQAQSGSNGVDDEGPPLLLTPAAEPPPPSVPAAERPPRPVEPRKSRFGRRGPPQPEGQGKPHKPAHRRVSIENTVATLWGLGAMALARSPQAVPVSRVMQMQAPVAGVIVEDAAKGTALDRLLQPLARGGEKAELAVALVAPPVLVGAITANPALYETLAPLLKMALLTWVDVAGPAMEKVAARQEKWEARFGSTADVDAMIATIFADVAVEGVPSSAEEAAVRRARGDQSAS